MMESFKFWFEAGLADPNVADLGSPKIKNTKLPNRYKIPDVSLKSFEMDRGMASKPVENLVHDYPRLGLPQFKTHVKPKPLASLNGVRSEPPDKMPKWRFDVTRPASTRLDPG